MRVGPYYSAIPILFRPVAVPCRRAVVTFGGVMPTLAMATHVKELVLDVFGCFAIERRNVVRETLPLGRLTASLASVVSWIGAIDETEIRCHKVEGADICRGVILEEQTGDYSVVEVAVAVVVNIIMCSYRDNQAQNCEADCNKWNKHD